MGAPKPYLAASLVELRDEINEAFPNRSTASDGWIGDTAHQARVSDHNPDPKGCVHAIDVTADGIEPDDLVEIVTLDGRNRCHYVIWNRHIYSRKNGFRPEPYDGSNPHTKHVHVSIEHTQHAENDTTEWMDTMPSPKDFADAVWSDDVIPDGADPKNPTWKPKNSLARIKDRVEDIFTMVKEIHAAVTKK